MNIFTRHPKSVGETYGEHMLFAVKSGVKMILGGIACILHGLLPFLFQSTGSLVVNKLHGEFQQRQGNKPPPSV